MIYPIALANLVLHRIDEPHLWHGNTLTGEQVYDGLFQDAPAVLMASYKKVSSKD